MDMTSERKIVVSIISHGQGRYVVELLNNIAERCNHKWLSVVVTINIPEAVDVPQTQYPFSVRVIKNLRPKGYGTNHNNAFTHEQGNAFCVINPDISFSEDPFVELYAQLKRLNGGAVAPMVVDPKGHVEDSARRLITPLRILTRVLGFRRGLDYPIDGVPLSPDWLAGMFLMFPSQVFERVGGFDERYFMYCEDADICVRLHEVGLNAYLIPSVRVTHDAGRHSHHDPRHFYWHIKSLMRFYASHSLISRAFKHHVATP